MILSASFSLHLLHRFISLLLWIIDMGYTAAFFTEIDSYKQPFILVKIHVLTISVSLPNDATVALFTSHSQKTSGLGNGGSLK
jgi:hypothetical protein